MYFLPLISLEYARYFGIEDSSVNTLSSKLFTCRIVGQAVGLVFCFFFFTYGTVFDTETGYSQLVVHLCSNLTYVVLLCSFYGKMPKKKT